MNQGIRNGWTLAEAWYVDDVFGMGEGTPDNDFDEGREVWDGYYVYASPTHLLHVMAAEDGLGPLDEPVWYKLDRRP